MDVDHNKYYCITIIKCLFNGYDDCSIYDVCSENGNTKSEEKLTNSAEWVWRVKTRGLLFEQFVHDGAANNEQIL